MSGAREHVLVAGSGITGLGVALALGGGRRAVTLLDRDPPPPETSPEEAFLTWERRGATQLRHSHAFIGRLNTLIRTRYPELLAELEREGARLFRYEDALPPPLKDKYRAQTGDDELCFLFSRRTTLELVLRRYVARLPGVRFVSDAAVRGLVTRRDDNGTLVVEGLQIERGGAVEAMHADVVVDATGRNTTFPDWLRAEGCTIAEEEAPCGILYYTRHYKLREGQDEPPRDGTPGGGDLGYIKFGVFAADNRHFSITLATPEIETGLRTAIPRPEIFEAICAEIPGAARWTEPKRSEPVGPVYSMGNLINLWRHYLKDGEPQALGFFALGDAAVRTNPLYGRGCSSGVVQAHILRAALDATPDPAERAKIVARETWQEIRPYFDSMVKADNEAIRRAEHERDPAYKPKLKARLMKSFVEDAITPASRGSQAVSRALSRAFHMIGHPTAWLNDPAIMARIIAVWAMPKWLKKTRGFYPPSFGPARKEMLARLGLQA